MASPSGFNVFWKDNAQLCLSPIVPEVSVEVGGLGDGR